MDKENFIESYEAPRVEVVEVEVEKGFAGSDDSDTTSAGGEGMEF